MSDHDRDTQMLNDMFATARDSSPDATADLMARVMRDAAVVQDGFEQAGIGRNSEKSSRRFGWRSLIEGLGGWPAMGGLVTATAVGVWLGLAPYTGLSETVAGYLFESTSLDGLETDYVWLDTLDDTLGDAL
ncbi:hypothetical protein KO498_13965 [Lentibacter algarum]|nr:hypothetical protein [Lentibacter algarum]